MSELLEILDMPFFRRALVAAALIGFTNGFVSGFVLLRRSSLTLSALSHTMLPGIVIVVLITGSLTQAGAFMGALLASLFVGLGSIAITRHTRLPQSTALAIFRKPSSNSDSKSSPSRLKVLTVAKPET